MFARFIFAICLCFGSGAVLAQVVAIDGRNEPYASMPAIQGITAFSMIDLRVAALNQAVGVYRTRHGASTLPVGSTIAFTYGDGSTEKALVGCRVSPVCVQPIPGTQTAAPSGTGGGGIAGWLPGGGFIWVFGSRCVVVTESGRIPCDEYTGPK